MATLFPVPPILKLRLSPQSGNKAMTVAWSSVYTYSSNYAYMLAQSSIDLTNMVAGDIVDVRITKLIDPSGTPGVPDEKQFFGVQPAERKQFKIGPILNVYGLTIDMRQPAGALKTFYCEFMVAMR